jgi:hypothetical protein
MLAAAVAAFRRVVLAAWQPVLTTQVALMLAETRLAAAERELAFMKQVAASSARDLAGRLADKDALVATKDTLVAAKDAIVVEKNARFDAVMKAHTVELAAAKFAADVAKSRLSVRAILETSIAEAFAAWPPPHDDAKTASDRLLLMLDAQKGCAGLKAYVRVAATDNGVIPDDALKEARKLYTSFCSRAHADAPEGSAGISSAIFESAGRTALIAYVAIVHYSGRRLSLYTVDNASAVVPLKMRTLRDSAATEANVRASKELVEID